MTGAQKGRGDMGFIEGRMRFGEGTRPTIYFAILAAVLTLPVVLLLAFPARALADADLSITKHKQGPPRVEPLEEFDYVLTVSNNGPDTATGVVVTDELPSGVKLVESEPDICGPVGGSSVACAPFDLEAGTSKTITLTVTGPLTVGVIENRATVEADGVAPVNSKKVTTTVAPNLVINKLDDPDPVDAEDVLLYTLRIENVGVTDADGVTVRDELPLDKMDFVTVDSADFECQFKAGIVKCENGIIQSGDTAKIEIVVEPEKAGTIQNTGAVFIQGVNKPLDTDTETTKVNGGGNGGNNGGNNGGPPDDGVPQGDQCSPVVEQGTDNTVGVISGTTTQGGTFTNTFSETLPLRIAYATSSEDDSLNITVTPKDGGDAILDETIEGKKADVVEVDTDAGVSYDVLIDPENQGFAVQLQIGSGTEPCTDPNDLDPPEVPGGGDDTNRGGNTGTGADDVIDETISDNPLPNTGGPSLTGIAVIALGLSVLGGATVVRTGVRRRDR